MFQGQSETSYIVPVIFLSNSLGVPLLPKTVDCEDYKSMYQKTENKDMLKNWYKLDEEAQPPCYVLQNTEEHIPNFKVSFVTVLAFFSFMYE